MRQKIIISKNLAEDIAAALSLCEHDRLFVLTDENTLAACWQRLKDLPVLHDAQVITIPSGDTSKTIETTMQVWTALQTGGATRHSCLINLGGGMVTDLGGFAAATFKRGINFINIPTTLLAMVDASVGGKTGVNFGGLKNEIGAFCDGRCVILDTSFLATLDQANLRSGYAEMLKHGLISDTTMWAELLRYDLAKPDFEQLQRMVADSVGVKERVVEIDPTEKGLRKALNLGHTCGHAIESLAMKKGSPVLHGYAVAWGMVCELYLSSIHVGFPTDKMRQTTEFILENYGRPPITCNDYDELITLMTHDKKNTAGIINFTLLGEVGDIRLDQTTTSKEIQEAFDFCREG